MQAYSGVAIWMTSYPSGEKLNQYGRKIAIPAQTRVKLQGLLPLEPVESFKPDLSLHMVRAKTGKPYYTGYKHEISLQNLHMGHEISYPDTPASTSPPAKETELVKAAFDNIPGVQFVIVSLVDYANYDNQVVRQYEREGNTDNFQLTKNYSFTPGTRSSRFEPPIGTSSIDPVWRDYRTVKKAVVPVSQKAPARLCPVTWR